MCSEDQPGMAGVILVVVVVVLLAADLKADFVVVAVVDAVGCWEVTMYRLNRGLQATAYYERKESFRH